VVVVVVAAAATAVAERIHVTVEPRMFASPIISRRLTTAHNIYAVIRSNMRTFEKLLFVSGLTLTIIARHIMSILLRLYVLFFYSRAQGDDNLR